jgi:arsenate reductase-like glutaredoxin family protein
MKAKPGKTYKTQEVADKAKVKIRIVQRWAKNHNVAYEVENMLVVYKFTEKQLKEFLTRDTKRGRRWPEE